MTVALIHACLHLSPQRMSPEPSSQIRKFWIIVVGIRLLLRVKHDLVGMPSLRPHRLRRMSAGQCDHQKCYSGGRISKRKVRWHSRARLAWSWICLGMAPAILWFGWGMLESRRWNIPAPEIPCWSDMQLVVRWRSWTAKSRWFCRRNMEIVAELGGGGSVQGVTPLKKCKISRKLTLITNSQIQRRFK